MDEVKDPSGLDFEVNALVNKNNMAAKEEAKIAPRHFKIDDEHIICLLGKELDDSFILLYPLAVQPLPDKTILFSEIAPNTPIRVYKSRITYSCLPAFSDLIAYLHTLQSKFEVDPEFFNQEKQANIKSLIDALCAQTGQVNPASFNKKVNTKQGITVYEVDKSGRETEVNLEESQGPGTFYPMYGSLVKH